MDGHQHNHLNEHSHHLQHNLHHPETTTTTPTPFVTTIMASMSNEEHVHHKMTTGSMDHMMKMYFHFGLEPVVLIKEWSASSIESMMLTCVFFFIIAIIYEWLKGYRRIFTTKKLATNRNNISLQQNQPLKHLVTNEQPGTRKPICVNVDGGDLDMDPTKQMNDAGYPSYGMRQRTECKGPCIDQQKGNEGTGDESQGSTNSNGHSSTNPIILGDADPSTSSHSHHHYHHHSQHDGNCKRRIPLFASINEMLSLPHLLSTLLYMLQVLFAYYLMLAFMLFNIWICLSIVLGAAFGHFLLAEQNQVLSDHNVEDYCH